MIIKKDIETSEDIKVLIDKFYEQVIADPVIGFIFTEVIELSWEKHIPIMNSFWNSILLGDTTYSGNPMIKHIDLHRRTPLTQEHFTRWKHLFFATLDDLFEGERVNEAKKRVEAMEILMLMKIRDSEQQGFIQ